MSIQIKNRLLAAGRITCTATPAIVITNGLDSIVRTGAGVYEITLNVPAPDDALCCIQGQGAFFYAAAVPVTTGLVRVNTFDDAGAAADTLNIADLFVYTLPEVD